MKISRIYQDYSIQTADESDKHYRPGWLNTKCPFCTGNPGNHLGYNINSDYFYCWRCGSHPKEQTLMRLLNISFPEAKKLTFQYIGKSSEIHRAIVVKKKQFKLPSGLMRISENKLATRYMTKRGFSPKDIRKIQKRFDLFCTGPVSLFDNMDLSFRLIAPIKIFNRIVSWQSRDLTNKSELKYLTCPNNREEVDHKTILYNETSKKETIILVEGIFDVWKVYLAGFRAVCCFGIGYTYDQLLLLLKHKKITIFFDPDKGGQRKAKELRNQLLFSGVECWNVKSKEKDPGDMSIKEIKESLK